MTDFRDDELNELLGAYALDAVEPEERDAIEAYLERSPRARQEVAEHREVAAQLAAGAPAPDHLWSRIAAEVTAAPVTVPAGGPTELRSRHRRSRPSRLLGGALAAAATAALVLGVVVARQDQRIADLRDSAPTALATAADRLLEDPSARQAQLVAADGSARFLAVVTPDGGGFLLAEDLPSLVASRTYQLWAIAGDVTVSVAVLGPEPSVVPIHVGPGNPTLAVTEETAGGVTHPTSAPLAAGTLA